MTDQQKTPALAEVAHRALERITELTASSVPGPWVWEAPSGASFPQSDEGLVGADDQPVLSGWGYDASGIDGNQADRDLITTLHRTLPAIIQLLTTAHAQLATVTSINSTDEPGSVALALDLAALILNEQETP